MFCVKIVRFIFILLFILSSVRFGSVAPFGHHITGFGYLPTARVESFMPMSGS